MRIGEFCTRYVVQCERTATALEVAQLMRTSHVGDVIVIDQPNGKKLAAGIVTDRDLVVKVLAREVDPTAVTAADIMSGELITAGEANDAYETAELMRFRGVRRLPVVDEDGGLVGIVTLDDLLKVMGDELTILGRVMSRERFQEQRAIR
ncbi:MAG: histidine kinase [Betaproteobacteria bacterium RIFCSPLOWO2_02_FULL_65_24]|nr:MAG: histidine kinase [Betaproteobacteria bacterium RIFCSPLOWO2_02_FULL_65_24]OGA97033.1 MAG: histidine kinase [Betaproteobacteria bacterium RIFCSPLOWO2_12_FULL_66_14]